MYRGEYKGTVTCRGIIVTYISFRSSCIMKAIPVSLSLFSLFLCYFCWLIVNLWSGYYICSQVKKKYQNNAKMVAKCRIHNIIQDWVRFLVLRLVDAILKMLRVKDMHRCELGLTSKFVCGYNIQKTESVSYNWVGTGCSLTFFILHCIVKNFQLI